MKIREHSFFEDFLEIGYIIDEAGLWCEQPLKVKVITLSSLNMTRNARINVLVHIYITTLTLLYSLKLQGGGAKTPSSPKSDY